MLAGHILRAGESPRCKSLIARGTSQCGSQGAPIFCVSGAHGSQLEHLVVHCVTLGGWGLGKGRGSPGGLSYGAPSCRRCLETRQGVANCCRYGYDGHSTPGSPAGHRQVVARGSCGVAAVAVEMMIVPQRPLCAGHHQGRRGPTRMRGVGESVGEERWPRHRSRHRPRRSHRRGNLQLV